MNSDSTNSNSSKIICYVIGAIIGAAAFFVFDLITGEPSDEPINTDVLQEYLISNAEAHSMITLHDTVGNPESLKGFIPIDVMLNYLAYVGDEANQNGIQVTGIDIFLARYPQQNNLMLDPNRVHSQGQLTYVIYPTTWISRSPGDTIHVPFDPLSSTSPNENNGLIQILPRSTADGAAIQAPTSPSALNRSQMSPPR